MKYHIGYSIAFVSGIVAGAIGFIIGNNYGFDAGYAQCQTDIIDAAITIGDAAINGIKSLISK